LVVCGQATDRLGTPVEDARIEVFKAERRLRLYSGDTLLREYRVGLGFQPEGTKVRQGDGATPEGDYFVCTKNPHSRYHLSLGINYPNRRDADAARGAGAITAAQRDQIRSAQRRRVCPPWNTALGGEIFIHGRGSSSDWTLGCVALDDPHIEELFAAVRVGTPVTIHP
jgi:murein L,D-transpeptidase YafK